MQPQFDALQKELAEMRRKLAPADGMLVSQARAAELLGVSERTVYAYAQAGQLPRVKLGTTVRYRVADLEAFAAANIESGATR
jgi:excisionase family DNA binding protein